MQRHDLDQQLELALQGSGSAKKKIAGHIFAKNLTDDEIQKIITQLESEIKKQNPNAFNLRAFMHKSGQGGPVNYSEAIRLFDLAIQAGDTVAMHNRAFMHANGQGEKGGKPNLLAAIKLYDQAIELKCAPAMYNRGIMHFNGEGGEKNYPAAMGLLLDALSNAEGLKKLIDAATLAISELITDHQDKLPIDLIYRLLNSGFLPENKIPCLKSRMEELSLYIFRLPEQEQINAAKNQLDPSHSLCKLFRLTGDYSDYETLAPLEPIFEERTPWPTVTAPVAAYAPSTQPAPKPIIQRAPVYTPPPPAFLFTREMAALPKVVTPKPAEEQLEPIYRPLPS
jgi:hypothetical protein